MAGGCTECGRKGGCDHRKGEMIAAIDAALARLYPTRCWGERQEASGFRAGLPPAFGPALADALARQLGTSALYRPGTADEYCDFVYVLCLGREPSLAAVREGLARPHELWEEATGASASLEELHLRVCLSALAPFVAVQQATLHAEPRGDDLVVTEDVRAGVFDPLLLPRFRRLVAVLAECEVVQLDFGEISAAPAGYDGGAYRELYGAEPAVANYLFFPQPCPTVTTSLVPIGAPSLGPRDPIDAPP